MKLQKNKHAGCVFRNDVAWTYHDEPRDIQTLQPVVHCYGIPAGLCGFFCVLRGFAWMDYIGGSVIRNGQPVQVLILGPCFQPHARGRAGLAIMGRFLVKTISERAASPASMQTPIP